MESTAVPARIDVYRAISEVTKAISQEGVAKNRKNQAQGYSFRGIDDIYNALAPMIAAADLCILPTMSERTVVERETQKGGTLFYVTVKGHFDFVSARDGSTHPVEMYGEAMDSADKATNKAMSAAYKYACMQAFCIPTEGDNDADAGHNEVRPSAPRQHVQPVAAQPIAPKVDPAKVAKAEVPAEVQKIWDTMTNADTSQKALMKLVNQAAPLDGAQALIDSELAKRKIESLNTIPDKKAYAALAWVIWKFINKPQTAAAPQKTSGLTLAKFHPDDRSRMLAALKKAKGWNQAQVELWLQAFTESAERAVAVADGMLFEFEMQGQAVSA
jgi:ERF superfamily protein